MQRKLVDKSEWRSVILPRSGTSYSATSPIGAINGPFFAWGWAGVPSAISGPSISVGTIVGARKDSDVNKLYEWNLYDSDDKQKFLVIEKQKSKIPNRYADGVYEYFDNAPKQIKKLFD